MIYGAYNVHWLKCWPSEFDAIDAGVKRHEIRRFDRPYAVGDHLLLMKWDPLEAKYLGPRVEVRVLHITRPGEWGLPDDLGVMSFEIIERLTFGPIA